ncbi:transglutaminase-like domain-containing protein [Actinomyces slackii]|uniref:Uncharacterized protein involved in cytokinesis, contains TGc (Transglutaminase/protease-like) domain n=1 Tax=Actinomyces slackii TaxID=52774 RepID=A0A3S4WGG3_9ACTO|nr:transglutaminase-like domain-containing protein [Actinomyces slackii]VEG74338.1 Uncharacterized protein involved in cytokinesis, contains TGc (transglutaminase/protease-like) domain [Actinomyces slackii]
MSPSRPSRAGSARLRPDDVGNRILTAGGRLEPVIAAAILCVAWWAAIEALEPIVAPGAWQLQALAVGAAAIMVPAVGRSLWPRHPLAALLVGLAAAGAMVPLTGLGSPYPELWWHDPQGQVGALRELISVGVPPVDSSGVLGSALVLACLVLAWSCAVLSAGGADAVGISGLVPASVLLLVPLVVSRSPSTLLLVVMGACLLGLILACAPARHWPAMTHDAGHGHGPSRTRRLTALGLGALALAVGAAVMGSTPVTQDHVWNPPGAGAGAAAPDTSLSLSDDLVRGSSATAFSYTGEMERGTSMRLTLAVISSLEGRTWEPDDVRERSSVEELQSAEGRGALSAGGAVSAAQTSVEDARGAVESVTIASHTLGSTNLPTLQSTALITEPVAEPVSLPPGVEGSSLDASRWFWMSRSTTATGLGVSLEPGQTYTALGWNAVADAEGRPTTPVPFPAAQPDPDALESYTELPEDMPAVIGQRAQAVVEQAGDDDGARAAALVAWLRGGAFVYDESAPYDADDAGTMDVVATFLEQRRGYCAHYASAFTAMARSLGIPTRIAIGYASSFSGPGQWTAVSGEELHAWPEVWLDGVGWVAFEPTPGGAGVAADEGAGEEPTPSAGPPQGATASSQPSASAPSSAAGSPPVTGAGRQDDGSVLRVLGWTAVALVVVCLLAGPALLRVVVRRRRIAAIEAGREPAARAWEELLDTARDLGLGGAPARARTEEAIAQGLAAVMGQGERAGDQGAGQALERVARAVVAERYGPAGQAANSVGPVDSVDTAGLVADVGTARAALRRVAGRWGRLRATVAPASLLPG